MPVTPGPPSNPDQASSGITVEVDAEEVDSILSDEEGSTYTASIASVHEWKFGRRYNFGSYRFPNDEPEQARLNICHDAFFFLLENRLFLAPIDPDGMRILDIGTGTGVWAIEMGNSYSSATIVGKDLSPIQPLWGPQNVEFMLDDIEHDWEETQPYGYIHCRYMAGSISDWPRLVRQCYQNLKPGGWVEFQETICSPYSEDGSLEPTNKLIELICLLVDACNCVGRSLDPGPSLKGWLQDAGFTRIQVRCIKSPIGTWPKDPRLKEAGLLLALNLIEGVDAFTAVLFREVMGWSPDEITAFNETVRKDLRRRSVHAMFDIIVITAQKPE
ncbi:S-adenosyl-L-methionine-dependent methyltransferase [Elaphomyces granulatus]